MDLDDAKKARSQAKRMYTRLENIIKVSIQDKGVPAIVERRFNELSQKWEKLQEEHDEVASLCANDTDVATEDEWLTTVSNSFYALEIDVHNYVKKSTEGNEATNNPPVTPTVNKQSKNMQLERMKFQPFNGDIRKFSKFKEEFTKHIQPECREDQAAFVLKSYLVEEVKNDVDNVDNVGRGSK
jgi:hypothetical protein